jgi:hypothetical protein
MQTKREFSFFTAGSVSRILFLHVLPILHSTSRLSRLGLPPFSFFTRSVAFGPSESRVCGRGELETSLDYEAWGVLRVERVRQPSSCNNTGRSGRGGGGGRQFTMVSFDIFHRGFKKRSSASIVENENKSSFPRAWV